MDRALELLAAFVIATGAIGLVSALLHGFHAIPAVLAGIAAAAAWAWWTRTDRTGFARAAAPIALLILAGLFFRAPPYFYVLGGQDEGVYVNMALSLERTGELTPRDPVLLGLSDPAAIARYVGENYGANYLPGVYSTPGNAPILTFQFYHLFPVWMAIFAGLFGAQASVWALTFLSLVSLLFLYRLALSITGSGRAALVAGLLLAVNPLHAFFSKFPVSEIPSLAFSAIGFTFLALYWRAPAAERRARWLVLSAGAFACLFGTRISGFIYLPMVMLLSAVALLHERDRDRRRAINLWAVSVAALYALSVAYGLRFSFDYSRDVYAATFEPYFGEQWRAGAFGCAAFALAGWAGLAVAASREPIRARLAGLLGGARILLGPALALALLDGLFRAWQLGFTKTYAGDAWLDGRFHLVGTGWHAFTISSVIVAGEYLSPFLLVALIAAGLRRWRDPALTLLFFLVLCFGAYVAVLQWEVLYQPYFARYMASEFVPYALVFVVCAWSSLSAGRARTAFAAALVLGGISSVALAGAQLGKRECDGAFESLGRIAASVDPGDLLLVDLDHAGSVHVPELKTALVYALGLQVANVTSASLGKSEYREALRKDHGDVLLLSASAEAPAGFAPVDALPYRATAFWQGVTPPVRTVLRINTRLFLYRENRPSGTLRP